MASKIFCDICKKVIEDKGEYAKRTYTIQHERVSDICNLCYHRIVKFIEGLGDE